MASSQAAYKVEQFVGHDDGAVLQQDIANYKQVGDNAETMKALVWKGKQKVAVIDTAKPKILEDGDVILKVTGSTVCGSDLHLLHGKYSSLISLPLLT